MLSTPKYVGEPSVESLASGLATLGRYGDEYMVHAAEGETVIPKEILDSNPQLKRDLFRQMMMMGIQDPNRYVVGSSLNSINPVTGQPEFFFKKIFKAVKKVFKKALPVIAPIVGNIIAPGIGGIIASGLVTKLQGGSWGDVLKSAAMSYAGSALMGGIGGAMNAPTGQGFSGFTSGLQQGLTAPFTAIGKLTGSGGIGSLFSGSSPAAATAAAAKAGTAGAGSPALDAEFSNAVTTAAPSISVPSIPTGAGPGDDLFAESLGGSGITQDATSLVGAPTLRRPPLPDNYVTASTPESLARVAEADQIRLQYLADQGAELGDAFEFTQNVATAPVTTGGTATQPIVGRGEYSGVSDSMAELGGAPTDGPYTPAAVANAPANATNIVSGADSPDRDFFQKTIDYFNPSEEAAKAARLRNLATYQEGLKADHLQATGEAISKTKLDAASLKWLQDNPVPGAVRRALPALGLGAVGIGGVLAATGAFDYEEEEQEFNARLNNSQEEMNAYDEWKKIPASQRNSPQAQSLYFKWHGQPNRTRSQFEYLTGGRSSRPDWMFLPEMSQEYRAMGGEVIGPGTGTSDSIPARLSDGEFVMTADAVRNAGGGDRNLGAARMYDMMRRFEGGTA